MSLPPQLRIAAWLAPLLLVSGCSTTVRPAEVRDALPPQPASLSCTPRCETGHRYDGDRIRGIDAPLPVSLTPASPSSPPHSLRRGSELTESELRMGRAAWRYFVNNTQAATGMVNAANQFPSTTLWDQASYLAGLVSARELAIIDKAEFDQRLGKLLTTMKTLPLFQSELPNKVYNTATGEKVNYANKPGEIGYSAIDLARWLVWSRIIRERYPEHADAVDQFIQRWSFCNVVKDGLLYGANLEPGKTVPQYLQEGRLGYEEYAAKGFALWGFDAPLAARAEPMAVVPIFGIDIPYDSRDPRKLGAHNYVVTESVELDGIEFGWDQPLDRASGEDVASDPWLAEVARRIYLVQERRYAQTGIVTARTEHQLDRAPYFVYDTIYSDGYPWNTITDTGKFVPEFAAVAGKGAMGLWALWDTPYTDLLYRVVDGLVDPEAGIKEGLYENGSGPIKTYTANNNGIILEALLHKRQGKLLRFSGNPSAWEARVDDDYKGGDKCHPKSCAQLNAARSCPSCAH